MDWIASSISTVYLSEKRERVCGPKSTFGPLLVGVGRSGIPVVMTPAKTPKLGHGSNDTFFDKRSDR